jgi:hypothetical protein
VIEASGGGTAARVKRLSLGLLTLLLLPLVPACEKTQEEPPLTIANKSAEEAADLTTDVACDYIERCGLIEVSCADCADPGSADCGGCTVEQVPVTHAECSEEMGPMVQMGFGCQPLTAEEEALVDECLAALPTAECPSVETVEDGEDPGEPPAELAACDVLEELMERCEEQSEPPSVPEDDEPQPG